VKCLTASDAEVFEFIAKPGAKIIDKPLKNLDFPDEAVIGGYIRGDNGYIANGNTVIHEGDKVVVFTLPSGIKKLEKFFK
jgi:trk system potassium uptake protein TrkA